MTDHEQETPEELSEAEQLALLQQDPSFRLIQMMQAAAKRRPKEKTYHQMWSFDPRGRGLSLHFQQQDGTHVSMGITWQDMFRAAQQEIPDPFIALEENAEKTLKDVALKQAAKKAGKLN